MVANRWSQHFLCTQKFLAKAVDKIMIWQDMERVVDIHADLLPLARFLGEAVLCYAKIGSSDSVHALLPEWMVVFFGGQGKGVSVFERLSDKKLGRKCQLVCDAYTKLQKEHDKLDRARWRGFVKKGFLGGCSDAHRFSRVQAAQEIVDAGKELSPHQLAGKELDTWSKV